MALEKDLVGSPRRPSQPDLNWAIATGFIYQRPGDWLPLLVEFDPAKTFGETPAARWQWFVQREWLPPTLKDGVTVPLAFRQLPIASIKGADLSVCVLLVRKELIGGLLASEEWTKTIVRAELGPPVYFEPKTEVELPLETKASGTTIERVVMGVIDQGIAFAHERFRNGTGTRVACVWQQDVIENIKIPTAGTTIEDSKVNPLLSAGLDEETIYRRLGGLKFDVEGFKPLARRRSHGTQVLDLMAGFDSALDEQRFPIIAVDMPEAAVGDPAGSLLTAHALWGIAFILVRAEKLRRASERLPVVVNISYGPFDGPHDGSSVLEQGIDLFIELFRNSDTPLSVVMAAGNSRQRRIHAELILKAGDTDALHWRLQPAGRTPTSMQLWLDGNANVAVQVTAPTGDKVQVSSAGPKAQFPNAGQAVFAAEYSLVGNQTLVTLNVAPTETDLTISSGHPVAPSGLWRIDVSNAGPLPIELHAWIRRTETLGGRRAKGRQSYFDEPGYRRFGRNGMDEQFDWPTAPTSVRRAATLSGAATGQHSIVIGGYIESLQHPTPYSSQGPHRNAARAIGAPDWLERSEDSLGSPGVLAAATRSNAVSTIGGTSAAAPQAARRIAARLLATGKPDIPNNELSEPRGHLLWQIPPGQKKAVVGRGLRGSGAARWPRRGTN
jgi:Subtilase family